ncbi:hypothetical protein CF165_45925 [Amycolatopsis vastitatis]|uniref:Integrase catalytic domain-containing protein n=1 Tax=Amycolatopsis vastitatis TaxID=1905142 RepID=A0A229SM85_9PSEU|nr:hypothetical protein CF165_45925 [Amycolatopsis vastitatis]
MRPPGPRSGSSTALGRSSAATASPTSTAWSPTTAPATARKTSPPSYAVPVTSGSRPTPHATTGKVERHNRILAEELLHAHLWTSEAHRPAALAIWNTHDNYHRPHTAAGDQPPASRLHDGVINVRTSYS